MISLLSSVLEVIEKLRPLTLLLYGLIVWKTLIAYFFLAVMLVALCITLFSC